MLSTTQGLIIASIAVIILTGVAVAVVLIISKKKKSSTKPSEPLVQAVAVGFPSGTSFTSNLLYSYDGETWKESTGTNFNYGFDGFYSSGGVNFGNNKWVATGWNKETDVNIICSEDGINWKEARRNDGMSIFYNGGPNDGGLRGNKVAYGGGKWVAVGKDINNENILYSTDGINWDVATMTSPGLSPFPGPSELDGGRGIAYNGGNWVAVGKAEGNIGNILYSTNGISWQIATSSDEPGLFLSSDNTAGLNVSYGNDEWLAVGRATNYSNCLVAAGNNVDTWENSNFTLKGGNFFIEGCYDIIDNVEKGIGVVIGSNGGDEEENIAFLQEDENTWNVGSMSNGISFPFTGDINGLTVNYSDNLKLFFASGGASEFSTIITSNNGISWNETTMSNNSDKPFGMADISVAFDIAVRS